MPRQIRQLPSLFDFLVSELGFGKLRGKFLHRSNAKLSAVAFAVLASGTLVQAASSVALEWEASPDTNVVGYFVFHGVVGTSYIESTDVGSQTQAILTNLFAGVTNSFYVTAYDAGGVESIHSALIFTNVPGSYLLPTVSPVPDQLIGRNASVGPIPLTIGSPQFPVAKLSLSGTSSNPALLPNGNILFGGVGSNKTVTALPNLGEVGVTLITLTVSDGILSTNVSFQLTVDPAVTPTFVSLAVEAESGSLIDPMAASSDLYASGGQSVSTTNFWSGTANFSVNIPVSGAYVIWRQ
jgi:hypothetical protein